ncbi:SDR family oxidoreductase [Alteriqipengyuania flavescens]|uniref:SDR family oxidoreductase n=1 Tax=Alteriqipengyuania flavescens TaxID=3053610 RepID=UPI0025B2B37A|nr:SDR family oxidoreductase [Alteriqipengyuania flavescens]WJY17989.1 SDR family oxidoreductase [Alteriqipengyuania flavescens]WJY23930.1 SDR family oxidoreductase [Alteriqipengyuania flavescens]
MTRPAVLVTGGARRIGAAIARAFGAAGWHVIIHYRTSERAARELADSLPEASTVQADLLAEGAAAALSQQLAAQHADWRCLVNSASVFEYDDAASLDPALAARAMRINAIAPARLAQAFLAHSRADARTVIQVTDQKLANPNPDFFSYSMSKHALAATIPMLAKAAESNADRIYGLAPGAILASHDQDEAETERSHRLNLLARRTEASEVADAALFLASGTLASGQTLFVDSGQHLLDQPRDVIFLAREWAGT